MAPAAQLERSAALVESKHPLGPATNSATRAGDWSTNSVLMIQNIFRQNDQMNLDEKVILSEWRPEWDVDFATLADQLKAALGRIALRVDHIGSTSVCGLSAKDVIDAQVIVAELDFSLIAHALENAGFVQKSGDWNLRDHIPAGWSGDLRRWSKLVFAPPSGARDCNVHIRVAGFPNERYAMLFRDFLRSDDSARLAWGRFKAELAVNTKSLSEYGAVKDPATDVLLALAERWAKDTSWTLLGQ